MQGLTKLQLAQTAQRQGLSRGAGFRAVRLLTTRRAWEEAWATARRCEQVWPPLNVVGPGA